MSVTSFSPTFSNFLQLRTKVHCVGPLIARSTTHAYSKKSPVLKNNSRIAGWKDENRHRWDAYGPSRIFTGVGR